jgi:DNA polymerase-3 subunit delta'
MNVLTDAPWLQRPLAMAEEQLASGRLPHALLLSGPAGWGQEWLADALVRRLLTIDDDRSLKDLAHPDLRQVDPDGAMLKIEQVRHLSEFATGTRQLAPAKVARLNGAHALNPQAANALLKTLEEPSPDTYLLLVTEYPGRLLPTIRSRCQQLTVRPDPAAAARWLEQHAGASPHTATLSFEYGGAPLAILAALEDEQLPLGPALSLALRARDPKPLQTALLDGGSNEVLLRLLRYLVAAQACRPAALPELQAVPHRALAAFQQELLFVHRGLLQSNSVNVNLQFERLAHRLVALVQPV